MQVPLFHTASQACAHACRDFVRALLLIRQPVDGQPPSTYASRPCCSNNFIRSVGSLVFRGTVQSELRSQVRCFAKWLRRRPVYGGVNRKSVTQLGWPTAQKRAEGH